MGGFRCSRQVIFLAATASKAWEPLSVAAAGDVHYVFATALVLCEAMKLLLLLPAVLLSSARAGRAAGVSWRAAALHYGLPSLLLGVCNLGLGYAVPRLGALLYQVVFQVSTVAATGALAVALLGQRLTAGQWGALGLLTVASIGAAHSRLGGGGAHEAPPSADGLVRIRVEVRANLDPTLTLTLPSPCPNPNPNLTLTLTRSARGTGRRPRALAQHRPLGAHRLPRGRRHREQARAPAGGVHVRVGRRRDRRP